MASECCFSRSFAKAAALVETWLPEETHKCRLPRHSVQYWMWKAKAGHQSQNSAPHLSLSLSLTWGLNQQLNHCLTITLFNTLHTHQTRCTLQNFRPQTLSLQQSTFGTPARSTVRAKMVVPHSHTDKSFTRRRVCSWDYTFTARRFGIGSSSSLLGHSRSSGESTDHKHGGHTNHCGHTLRGRKKKGKRNCHKSGHWSKLCSLQSIQLHSLLKRWDVGNANLRFGKDPTWNF